MISEAYIKAYM